MKGTHSLLNTEKKFRTWEENQQMRDTHSLSKEMWVDKSEHRKKLRANKTNSLLSVDRNILRRKWASIGNSLPFEHRGGKKSGH